MVFADETSRVIAYGDAGAAQPLDADSVFDLGSLANVFTGTLLAQAVQRDEAWLTDPVAGLLPAGTSVPSRAGRQITLVDLATHTSRLPTGIWPTDPDDCSAEQLYELLDGCALTCEPGSRFQYSRLGVALLGHALALRAGCGYEELVQRILRPLGMTSTATVPTPEMARRLASGHDERGAAVSREGAAAPARAGALRSSMTDMLRFAAANVDGGGGALRQAMAAARSPRKSIDVGLRIGLAWSTLRSADREIVAHDGASAGFAGFVGIDEARRTAIVLLSNSAASVEDVGYHVLDERLALVEER
jgi:D-alanyl-D-alanine-carboxypeptidase/D-alanyl-D-alanine-endopeptidase